MNARRDASGLASSPSVPDSPLDIARQIAARHVGITAALGMGLVANTSLAATFIVNNFTDTPAAAGCTTADCTLREAITHAINTAGAGHIIKFKTMPTPQNIPLTAGDLPTISETLTITGPGAGLLTVTADANSRIFDLNDANAYSMDVTLSGMTLTGGDVFLVGGAIRAESGDLLKLSDMVITGNHADVDGGAIYVDDHDLLIENSIISNNTADGAGGAIAFYYTRATGTVIRNTRFINNDADAGGAIALGASFGDTNGPLLIENSHFTQNDATSGRGGAIFLNSNTSKGRVVVRNSTFDDNSATDDGGAIGIVRTDALVLVENSTFYGNETTTASGLGGAFSLFAPDADGLIQMRNNTVSGNHADNDGGGLYTSSRTLLLNTIVSDNTTSTTRPDLADFNTGDWVIDNSLVGDLTGTTSPSITGGTITGQSALLQGLGRFGGFTPTIAPIGTTSALSPVIDTGSTQACADVNSNKDQRGVSRAFDGDLEGSKRCDIGAYEFNGNAIACPATAAVCLGSGTKGSLSVVNNAGTKTDSIKAAITAVTTPTTTFFGNPVSQFGTPSAVCIYSAAGTLLAGSLNVPAGGTNSLNKNLWTLASTGKTTYTNSVGNADGVTLLSQTPSTTNTGINGAVSVTTKTGAVFVPMDAAALAAGNMLTLPVTVQFTTNGGISCVSTTFTTATANTPLKFTAVK